MIGGNTCMSSIKEIIRRSLDEFLCLSAESPEACPEDGLKKALAGLGAADISEDQYESILAGLELACLQQGLWEIPQTEPYQFLSREEFQLQFHDFHASERFWRPLCEQNLQATVSELHDAPKELQTKVFSDYAVTLQIENPQGNGISVETAAMELLSHGNIVAIPSGFIRKVLSRPKCPKCGNNIMDLVPPISRIDNKTLICSSCAMEEAMDDYFST